MQVQALPAQSAAAAGLWEAWSGLRGGRLSSSKEAHSLVAASFAACCGATIAVVKMALQVLPSVCMYA